VETCAADAVCGDILKGLPAAFVAFVIGCIAARIAYNQYLVAQAKLKLDLFDKRRAVFVKILDIVIEIEDKKTLRFTSGVRTPFAELHPDVEFLFGPELKVYIQEMSSRWRELWLLAHESMNIIGSAPDPHDKHRKPTGNYTADQLMAYFAVQATRGVVEKFSPYLNFQHWK
jgi:hypothetical protein